MHTIIRDNYDPTPNEYHETIVVDEARGKRWLFDCDGVYHDITNVKVVSERGDSEEYAASQKWVTEEVEALEAADTALQDNLDAEETARIAADETLQDNIDAEEAGRIAADTEIWDEIEALEAASDVVDIVGTYAELENYDTSALQDNDIIKVLQDETHDDAIAYYRWNTATDTFTFVGVEGPYYTASETDTLLADKQDKLIAGSNIQIAADGKTISATDTTYSTMTGATSSAAGASGLVPAPLAGDQNKVLKGDGTWGDASAYTLPPATTTTLGGIIVGNNLTVDANGTLDATNTTYTAGTNVQISAGNVISATDTTYTAGANIQISASNVISATDTTYSAFTGATSSAAGTSGLVPAPQAGDDTKFLSGDGTWKTVTSGSSYTAGNGIYIDTNNEISIDTAVVATQTDLAGKQDTLTAGTNITIVNNTISAVTNNISSTDWNALWQ